MHFSTSITQLASTPPWANVINYEGVQGFWVDTNLGQPVFLRKQDQVIWLPKTLRGKRVEQLQPDEMKQLPTEDQGKTHYKRWRAQNDAEQTISKMHNGYAFEPQGQALLDRLIKVVDKYELDNTQNLGLDPRYSINSALLQKLTQTNNREDVARIGRVIGKKFVTIIHLLNQTNPKLAKRLDADFMFAYQKLQPLFGFDPTTFQPALPAPGQQDQNDPVTVTHLMVMSLTNAIKEIRPLMAQDLAFYPIMQGFTKMLAQMKMGVEIDNIDEFKETYTTLMAQVVAFQQGPPPTDPFKPNPAAISQQVVQSPALQDFHQLLMV